MPGFVGAVTPRQFLITIWMTYSKVRARLAARRHSEYGGQEVMGLPHSKGRRIFGIYGEKYDMYTNGKRLENFSRARAGPMGGRESECRQVWGTPGPRNFLGIFLSLGKLAARDHGPSRCGITCFMRHRREKRFLTSFKCVQQKATGP